MLRSACDGPLWVQVESIGDITATADASQLPTEVPPPALSCPVAQVPILSAARRAGITQRAPTPPPPATPRSMLPAPYVPHASHVFPGSSAGAAETHRRGLVQGEELHERVQGGLLGDGVSSLLAAACTSMPNTTFSQNNGVISLTRCASRHAGIAAVRPPLALLPPEPQACVSSCSHAAL